MRTAPEQSAEKVLPKPACELGYTADQVEQVVGGRQPQFDLFMRGQTVAICQTTDGPGACRGGHGLVVYSCDLRQFLRGGAPLD